MFLKFVNTSIFSLTSTADLRYSNQMAGSIDELFECFEQDEQDKLCDNSIDEGISEYYNILKRGNEEKEQILSKRFKGDEIILNVFNPEDFKNRTLVYNIDTVGSCTHEVACPFDQEFISLQPRIGEPAKTYSFSLDSFQQESILCIDNNQSVLVSAHTSAGKTVIAEYAVAKSLKYNQRVIYTTPIKALSNQKYREFNEEFKDVGLVTGDVTLNPSASCLIMTTEILRNMLYRGSEVMREVGWVIFDEIHYMRDKERGVVWEETLILLPHNVHFVFLSATIPNARQFAEWIAYLHQQPCHVVYTDFRPTPLEHYIYPAGAEGIHLMVDESGTFRENNFNNAMAVLQNIIDNSKDAKKSRRYGIEKDESHSSIFKLVKMIMVNDLEPVIIFSFSKKDCEFFAMHMTKLDFNESSEKQLVDTVINNALAILSEDDRHLPQVESTIPLLRRGIGVHHGGLLPILKETTEILFGEGLIKVLFATETFAMGLNMPARTVLFTGIKKFDGHNHRWMSSGEYIQMTGRAGRRGRDKKGTAILMIDDKIRASVVRDLVKGLSDPLNSAFHLTYNMVLNHLRVEEINPEYMLERSFYQFQKEASIPGLHDNFRKTLEKYKSFKIEKEDQIASYYNFKEALDVLSSEFRIYLTKPQYLVRFLQPGRLVKVKIDECDYNWGVVVDFKKVAEVQESKDGIKPQSKVSSVQMDVLLHVILDSTDKSSKPCMWQDDNCPCSEELQLLSLDSKYITQISSVRLPCAGDLAYSDSRKKMYKSLKFVKDHFKEKPPLLKPVEDMKIQEPRFLEIVKEMNTIENRLKEHPLLADPILESELEKYGQKIACDRELIVAKQKLLYAKSILHLDELKRRKQLLRRLGYCTETDVIQLKGRVACELSSADEILLTEMLYDGLFGKLSPQQICALLSCLVCDERSNETQKLPEELSGPLRQMQDLARRVAKVSKDCHLPLDEEIYVEQLKPYLMNVVFAWCNSSSFADLCKMTEIFEGSIIRCIRRLEELLRQMVQASKIIGNSELEDKFTKSITLLKRDIIFSASLYL